MIGAIESLPVLIVILVTATVSFAGWAARRRPQGGPLVLGLMAFAGGYAVGPLSPDAAHFAAGQISIGLVSDPALDWTAKATCARQGGDTAIDFVFGNVTVDGHDYRVSIDLGYARSLVRPESAGSDPDPTVFVGVGRPDGSTWRNGADRSFSMNDLRTTGQVVTDPIGADSGPDVFGNVAGPFELRAVRARWSCP
jgi:hypothetical protein